MNEGRDVGGRFVPGYRGGPGRRPIPERLKAKSDELLDFQLRAVLEGRMRIGKSQTGNVVADDGAELDDGEERDDIVPAKTRAALSEALLNRIHGKAPQELEVKGTEGNTFLAAVAAEARKAREPRDSDASDPKDGEPTE